MGLLQGSCLCGKVKFAMQDDFSNFQFCHCTQCQKTTGSAHASNAFTTADNITWQSGEESITRFDVEGRTITNAFCTACGSRVPYVSRSGKLLVVPAGVLDQAPSIQPKGNIFWGERADWYDSGTKATCFEGFIE